MEKIDFVILWVDDSDPVWKKKREKYSNFKDVEEVRYRDYGSLKYIFRSIEKYAPWVNKVHLVTDQQIPEWLNYDYPKLNLIFHDFFIPGEYLPTFNSNVIELNLFRIEELSEKFVLFNDDTFLNSDVSPHDFFNKDDIIDFGVYNKIAPNEEFAHTLVNDLIIINNHFSKIDSLKKNWNKQFRFRYGKEVLKNFLLLPWKDIPGYYNHHFPQPHFKSVFKSIFELEPEVFKTTFKNKFRQYNDINHWLCRYWLLEEGRYQPQKSTFGDYFELSKTNDIANSIKRGKSKVLCINDVTSNNEDFEKWTDNLLRSFELKFPEKSSFEK